MSEEVKPAAQDQPNAAAEPKPEVKPEAAAPAQEPKPEVKPEAKPEEKPQVENKEAKPAVPEKYDLKLAEDSVLDSSVVEKVAALAKERGLSNDDAQKFLEQEEANVAEFIEKRKTDWAAEIQGDKEIGGEAFKENVELAHRVIKRYGTESLTKELNRSGYGNHPELVRLLSRIGKSMSEDQLVLPGAQAGGKKNIEDIFYPTKP